MSNGQLEQDVKSIVDQEIGQVQPSPDVNARLTKIEIFLSTIFDGNVTINGKNPKF